jgi:hypothetical protein
LPVGVPAPGAAAETLAVKVTAWPYAEGLAEEVTDVVVSALLTVWVIDCWVLPLLALKLLSPA